MDMTTGDDRLLPAERTTPSKPEATMTDEARSSSAESDVDAADGRLSTVPGTECADCYFPRRYVVVLLLFVGLCVAHAQRVNVGVAVVSILDARHRRLSSGPALNTNKNQNTSLSDIQWDSHMIGWLHAVFYVGLLVSQVPCGYLVTKLPSNRLFGGCILITHSLNFLLPLSIQSLGYIFTCSIRLLQGFVEGLLYPACYDVMRHWTIPEERSRTGAIVLTGAYIGPTLGMIASGLLNHYAGWMYVFYFHGALGLVWYFVWLIFVYERPSVHPHISVDECKTIESRQGDAALIYEHDTVPWKAILTSLPVYALVVCNFARSFVFYMLLTSQPTYLNIFNFTLAENGLYCSLPYAFMAMFAVLSGPVADLLMTKSSTTPTLVRKMFTCFGFGLAAIFFFALAIAETGVQAVVCLTLAVGLSGIAISGWQINHLDLAPRYAGVLVAVTMTFGMVAGVVNPLVVAALTPHQELSEWHNVFWLTGLVLTFALVFYALFGSGDRQTWSTPGPPPVRIVTPSDPLQGKPPPYGTFSPQVRYNAATSELTLTNPMADDLGGGRPPASDAEKLADSLSGFLDEQGDERTSAADGEPKRRKSQTTNASSVHD